MSKMWVLMVWRKPRAVSSASDPSVPLTAQVPRPEVVEERKKMKQKKWRKTDLSMNLSADLRRYDSCLFCSKIFIKPPTIQTANLQRIIAGALCLGRRCVSLLLIQTHKVYRLCTDVYSFTWHRMYTTASLKYSEGAHWP